MELLPLPPKSDGGLLDLILPTPEIPLPARPDLPLETVLALNDEFIASCVYDEAYFVRSLARKNPEPFVL